MQPEFASGATIAEKLGIIEESVHAWQSPDQQMRSLPAELAVIIAAQMCYVHQPPPGPPPAIFALPSAFPPDGAVWPKKARCGLCFAYNKPDAFGSCIRCGQRKFYFCAECNKGRVNQHWLRECIWCQAEPRRSIAIAVADKFYNTPDIAELLRHQYRGDCIVYDDPRVERIVAALEFPFSERRWTSKLLESTDTVLQPAMLIVCWSFCGNDDGIRACASLAKERNILTKGCRQRGGN